MSLSKFLTVIAIIGCSLTTLAGETDERELFGKWRVAVGYAFNGCVSSDLHARNLPIPASPIVIAPGNSIEDAFERAANYRYDGGGFVAPDSVNDGWQTQNWQFPQDSYKGDGRFELNNSYQAIVPGKTTTARSDGSDDPCQHGISLELSRELWLHDENDEHRWGVDFAAGFSYFFQNDLYKSRGSVTRSDSLLNGVVRTFVNDPMATYEYERNGAQPINGYYGHASYSSASAHPALMWDAIDKQPVDVGGTVEKPSTSTARFSASGDYQELEMLFTLRPWYELTDWWRIYGNVGAGVSWGRFTSEFRGVGVSADEDFDEWDVYGVAGLGTIFRYDQFDISLDVLGRFFRDDMEIDGRYVDGSLSRADWGVRLMVGVEF